ncbi:MAG TPA: hypothetical protein VJC09_03250 [Candidatus Saccharimonadales bacterium]|nr:hypothetical protein [Candidatus Saccharimonadales bacterium]
MTNSLGDILANKFDEPPEIAIIKSYVQRHFKTSVGVTLHDTQIVINAPGAALAATLRMQLPQLQKELKTDKKLLIRIGR